MSRAAPGMLAAMLSVLSYRDETGWKPVEDLRAVSEIVQTPGTVVWASADVGDLSKDDIATISDEFGLHPLAVEDAMHTRQRPKFETYDAHLFAVMHQIDETEGQFEAAQLACFIGQRWVITLHEGAQRTVDEALRRMRRMRKQPDQGPSFIMHALLDSIVDEYERKADQLEDEIERFEEMILTDPAAELQSRLYSLKQRIARLRRYCIPGERVLAAVVDNRSGMTTERTAALFRDVHDHLLRIIDQIKNVDDLTNAVIDLQRAHRDAALNQVIKRLTGWAAIIAVPTFIASVYGMNFDLVPPEGAIGSFYGVIGVMLVTSALLYRMFKRRDWL